MLLEEHIVIRYALDIPPQAFKIGSSNAIYHLWEPLLEACNEGHDVFKLDVTLPNEVRHTIGPAFWQLGGRGSLTKNPERPSDFFLLVFHHSCLVDACWVLLTVPPLAPMPVDPVFNIRCIHLF